MKTWMAEIDLKLLLIWIVLATAATDAQSNGEVPLGDVRLTCLPPYTHAGIVGSVTVYEPVLKTYVPVCREGFNRAAAAAVCRQLGFEDAKEVDDDYYGAPNKYKDATGDTCLTPIATSYITHIRCPNVSNYVVDGELHVMRCSVGNLTTEKCSEDVAAVECSSTLLQDSAQYRYNAQVYLAHTTLVNVYSGTASIRIDDNNLPLCGSDLQFNSIMANSVCRQLGYTNNKIYEIIPEEINSVNLLSSACNKETGSFPCFSHCISNGDYIVTKCKQVKLFCDFLTEDMITESSGNHGQCALRESQGLNTAESMGIGILIGFLVLAAFFFTIATVLSCLVIWKRRSKTDEEVQGLLKSEKQDDRAE